ncbi:MAG: hypothetical protein HYV08_00405, partial [Deltaproteobacteria bacterium]|nr:hypothetical protein [Deltaproteobacteria bacterium]
QYYATFGDGAKWQLDGVLDDYEQRKRVGFRPWWLHPHQEYWDRTKACVNAYGGGQAVVQLEKKWNESRGYPK